MKKYNKYYLVIFIILIFLIYSFKKYQTYIFELDNLRKLEIKKEQLLTSEENTNEDIVYIDKFKNLAIKNETEFLKLIFSFIEKSNLKLVDSSSEIKKDEDLKYELIYKSFKLEGSLEEFYYFLNYIFLSNLYIDTKYCYIDVDYSYINISLGYVRLK